MVQIVYFICTVVLFDKFLLSVVATSATKHCNGVFCKEDEFCDQQIDSCDNCSIICLEESLKYDDALCKSECGEYWKNYMLSQHKDKVTSLTSDVNDLKDDVKRLESLLGLSFILIGLLILTVCVLILFLIYKWCQRRGMSLKCFRFKFNEKKKLSTNNNKSTKENNLSDVKVEATNRSGDLHLKIADSANSNFSVTNIEADSPATITTSVSHRGAPSESRALDYAYDNPAMSAQETRGSHDVF